jgi:hypothetical protein
MNDGQVPLNTDDDENENGGCVTHLVDIKVHLTHEDPKIPSEKEGGKRKLSAFNNIRLDVASYY